MRYFRSYSFLFKSPNWPMNMLLNFVIRLLPIVGDIIVIGYFFEVIEHLHRRGSDESYPDFDLNRFVKYLVRGVWAFLAIFLIQMLVMPLAVGAYLAIVFSWVFVGENKLAPETALLITSISLVVLIPALFIAALLGVPVYLRAGLQQEFKPAFSPSYLRDFYGRIGGTVILTLLFKLVTAPFVWFAGVLLCLVGVIPAEILISFSSHHLLYQLYQQYLRAGGAPFPLKPEDQPEKDYGEEFIEDERAYPQ